MTEKRDYQLWIAMDHVKGTDAAQVTQESFVNGKPEAVIHTSSPGRCSKVGEAFLGRQD
jgi:hypothetical protein